MRSYTKPDFDTDIEVLRTQVERDYAQMVKRLKLPKRLDFTHAREAVLAGGLGMQDDSPYDIFKNDLLHVVTSVVENENELQDIFEILTGVWNFFPHNDLDGLSPIEKMRAEPTALEAVSSDRSTSDEQKYETALDREILSFSKAVAGNLLNYLKDVGLGEEEQQHILAILSDPYQEPDGTILYLFERMTSTGKTEEASHTIDDIQPAVRALMWCENYTASKMPNGHWNSRMFQNIVEQAIAYNTRKVAKAEAEVKLDNETVLMIDPLSALQALSLIHDAISEFSETFKIDIGMEEATRHLVDWLTLTDLHELLVRKDLNLTTFYFLGAARLIAATGDPKRPYKRLATRLQKEVASHVEPTVFDKEVRRIAEKALNAARDPVMLMPYPGKEPRNCLERLTELAPAIKLRSPLNGDPSLMPPPFFPQ